MINNYFLSTLNALGPRPSDVRIISTFNLSPLENPASYCTFFTNQSTVKCRGRRCSWAASFWPFGFLLFGDLENASCSLTTTWTRRFIQNRSLSLFPWCWFDKEHGVYIQYILPLYLLYSCFLLGRLVNFMTRICTLSSGTFPLKSMKESDQ